MAVTLADRPTASLPFRYRALAVRLASVYNTIYGDQPMSHSDDAPMLEIRLLGRFDVQRGRKPIAPEAWPRRKTAELLKLLATDRGRHVTQDELIDQLFPNLEPGKARRNLQNRISELRRVLEPDLETASASRFIVTEHEGYRFSDDATCWVDVEAFEDALQAARLYETDGRWTEAAGFLNEAVDLYVGDYLVEDRYADWTQLPRRRLRDQYVSALSRLATCRSRLGQPQAAIEWARRAFDAEPSRESLCAQLMGLYRQTGQTMEALTIYETHRETLRNDLAVEPSAEIDALRSRILNERSTQVVPQDHPSEPSLAVLPFLDLTANDTDAYVAEGLTEDVIAQLGKLRGLRVLAPSAVRSYRERNADLERIRHELNVTHVLKGSVRHDARHVRIVVALIDVATAAHQWTETYDRRLSEIFVVQREIAEAIARSLRAELSLEDQQRLGQPPTASVEAYHRYLQGRYFMSQRTKEAFQKAEADFQAALEIDPGYASAHAGLAETYGLMAWFGYAAETRNFPKARNAALRALDLDPQLPDAHAVLGQVAMNFDWSWDMALASFQSALELQPSSALAHEWHAECLVALGRFDAAIAEMTEALRLDPLSLVLRVSLGWMHYFARTPDDALGWCQQALELDPHYPIAHWVMGLTHLSQENHERAIDELRQAERALPTQTAITAEIGFARARMGHRDRADAILTAMDNASASMDPVARAILHLGLDDPAASLEWLELACERRARHLAFLGVDPLFDDLRDEPRFRELLHRIGTRDVLDR